jgi:lambda family phage portal protein
MADAKLGLFDRAADAVLSVASPRRLAIRQHLRRLDNDRDYRDLWMAAMNARGYRASGKSGSKTPWTDTNSSADTEILQGLPALRSRSREVNRDDPIGSGLTETFVNNIVAAGMAAQAKTPLQEKNKRLEQVWASRKEDLFLADDLDFEEAQRLQLRKVFEDGDILVKTVSTSPGEPLWFELIEADRLATPPGKTVVRKDGRTNEVRDGVERDSASRPVKYWILKHHPGDRFAPFAALDSSSFETVDKANIRHLKVTKRPGQTRGVPAFHAILQDLRDLDLLILASLKRVQIAACFAAVIQSPEAWDDMVDVTTKKFGFKMDQSIEPGMMFKLYPGETLETIMPNFPTPELAPFIITLARRIGAALGVTWQIVLKDFSEANYSSARTDLLEARQGPYVVMQRWFAKKALTWQWIKVMEDALLRGDTRLRGMTIDDFRQVSWIPNGWSWVDPQREARATEIELRIGATTLRDVAAARGDDWEDLQDQRLLEEKREMDRRKELGLPPKQEVAPPQPGANGNGRSVGARRIEVGADDSGVVYVGPGRLVDEALGDGNAGTS